MVVRDTGVEPVRIARRILSPLGLPIPPISHLLFTHTRSRRDCTTRCTYCPDKQFVANIR